MILPYFLSLRRSLSHTLPKHALSLSLRAILSLSPFHSSTLSLSLCSLCIYVSILFNRYTHSRIEYRGKYIDKGFI